MTSGWFATLGPFSQGVVTGVASSALIWLGRGLLGRVLGEAQAALSRGANIQDKWKAVYHKEGMTSPITEHAKLSQFGQYVWGRIRDSDNRTYQIRGTIRNRVLVATTELVGSKSALDRGTFTLRLSDDGMKLEGSYSWLAMNEPLPKSGTYAWERDASR